jgi:hypothetical protein
MSVVGFVPEPPIHRDRFYSWSGLGTRHLSTALRDITTFTKGSEDSGRNSEPTPFYPTKTILLDSGFLLILPK